MLVRFSYDDVQDSSSLSLCRYITQRERKRQALFEGRQDVLVADTVRIEQRNGSSFSSLLQKTAPSLFFLLLFLFFSLLL